jgi:hypothetical protein
MYWIHHQKFYRFKFKIYSLSNEFSMKSLKDEMKTDGNIILFQMNEKSVLKEELTKYHPLITRKPW